MPLNKQELLNSIYSGPFVTKAKAEYSNSNNANMQKWSSYVKGDPSGRRSSRSRWTGSRRLRGISVDAYLAQHRHDDRIDGLKTYFTSVIDWIGSVFIRPPDKEMRGLDWGGCTSVTTRRPTTPPHSTQAIDELRADPAVQNTKGIYEYLLGGKTDLQLLDVRLFDENDEACRLRAADRRRQRRGRIELSAVRASATTPTRRASTSRTRWTPTT